MFKGSRGRLDPCKTRKSDIQWSEFGGEEARILCLH
jgi:hypothetical protein